MLQLRNGHVDLRSGKGVIDGAEVRLTSLERRFLERLVADPERVVPTTTLLVDVWEASPHSPSRAIEVLVRRLRQKLGDDTRSPTHLHTERGVGFRFVPLQQGPAPAASSGLIGREALVTTLRALANKPGLTCLVGPGGVGKTRLVTAALPDAWFVGLGGARDEAELQDAVRLTLGLSDRAAGPAEVSTALRDRPIVLDNFEQLPDGCAAVAAALAELAPVFVTSQRFIGHPAERRLDVGPLEPADARDLLARRLAAAGGTAAAPVLRRIADRLGGLPLAIEILAPMLALGGPQVADLDALDLPNPGPHAPARHLSLRALYDRSWDLRGAAERQALLAFARFEGRFDLTAAAAVLGDPLPATLVRLRSLVDSSWLQTADATFWLLESARAFLREMEPDPAVQQRLVVHLASLARAGGDERHPRIERYREDLFRALAVAEGELRTDLALALVDLTMNKGGGARLESELSQVLDALPAGHPDTAFLRCLQLRAALFQEGPNRARLPALEALHARGDATAHGYLALCICVAEDPEQVVAWARVGLEHIETEPRSVRLRLRGFFALQSGDDEAVRRHLALALEEATDEGVQDAERHLRWAAAAHELNMGRPEVALRILDAIEDGADDAVMARAQVYFPALLLTDQHQRARVGLERFLGWATAHHMHRTIPFELALAAIELDHGEPAAARARAARHLDARSVFNRSLALVIDALSRGLRVPQLPDPVLEAVCEDWRAGRPLAGPPLRIVASAVLMWLLRRTPRP